MATATDTFEYTKEAQERALGAIRQSQEAVVEAVGSWAKAVESSVPESVAIPVLKGMPSVDEIVKSSFDFAGEVLKSQRKFTEDLVAAAAPAVKTTEVDAPKVAAKA